MAEHSPYQKGVIRRYYEHRGDLAVQKLGEAVSNLYGETDEKKLARAWKAVHRHLLTCGVHQHEAGNLVQDRDLGALARLVERLF